MNFTCFCPCTCKLSFLTCSGLINGFFEFGSPGERPRDDARSRSRIQSRRDLINLHFATCCVSLFIGNYIRLLWFTESSSLWSLFLLLFSALRQAHFSVFRYWWSLFVNDVIEWLLSWIKICLMVEFSSSYFLIYFDILKNSTKCFWGDKLHI